MLVWRSLQMHSEAGLQVARPLRVIWLGSWLSQHLPCNTSSKRNRTQPIIPTQSNEGADFYTLYQVGEPRASRPDTSLAEVNADILCNMRLSTRASLGMLACLAARRHIQTRRRSQRAVVPTLLAPTSTSSQCMHVRCRGDEPCMAVGTCKDVLLGHHTVADGHAVAGCKASCQQRSCAASCQQRRGTVRVEDDEQGCCESLGSR